jgi:hypothetical protein
MKYMHTYPSFIQLLPLLICLSNFGCKKDVITSNQGPDFNYPTTLYPLSQEKIQQLQNEFDSLNNHLVCSHIDKYGFVGNDRYDRIFNYTSISQDSALFIAVNTLLRNSKFTNVRDSATLVLPGYRILSVGTKGIKWKIVFGPQIYHGFEVLFGWIYVWVYGNEPYTIANHWYSDVYIPSIFIVSKDSARKKVIGEKIIWYGEAGNPLEFVVTDSSVSTELTNVIVPIEKENSIELRVTWKIPILFFPNGDVGWHIYLDVMNGEEVMIVQEFRT